jgi:hypothetical protein
MVVSPNMGVPIALGYSRSPMDTLKPSLIGELLSRFDDLLAEAQYPRECVASVPSEIANRSFPNDARTLNAMNEQRRRK